MVYTFNTIRQGIIIEQYAFYAKLIKEHIITVLKNRNPDLQ